MIRKACLILMNKDSTPAGSKRCSQSYLASTIKSSTRKGYANSAADALSRRPHPINTFEVSTCNAISMVKPKWLEKVIQSYEDDEMTKSTIAKLVVDANDVPNFTYSGGLLRYKTRIWVGADSEFQYQLIAAMHSSTMGGHSDVLVTYRRMKQMFA
jgi:hypothetical protein